TRLSPAEDGRTAGRVTGVHTCARPSSRPEGARRIDREYGLRDQSGGGLRAEALRVVRRLGRGGAPGQLRQRQLVLVDTHRGLHRSEERRVGKGYMATCERAE